MLLGLGISDIEIFTNNPDKVRQSQRYGVTVGCQRPARAYRTKQNQQYLRERYCIPDTTSTQQE
jgi:GTP cyclohydrolase II